RGEWARTPAPRAGGGPALSRLRETGFIAASLRQELTDYKVRAVAPDVGGGDVGARAGAGHELGVKQLTRDFFEGWRHQQVHAAAARERAKWLSRIGFERSHRSARGPVIGRIAQIRVAGVGQLPQADAGVGPPVHAVAKLAPVEHRLVRD